MNIHFYGRLDGLDSCYTFQSFDIDGITILLQNAPRFGYVPSTVTISNPAMFIIKDSVYYRFVVEDYKLEVIDGCVCIRNEELIEIKNNALELI